MPNRTFFSNDDIINGKLCVSDNQNDIYNLTYRFLYTNQSTSQDHYAIVAEASGSCLSVKFVDAVMPQETRFINYSERCSDSGLCFFVLDEDNFDLYFDTISNCISSGYESSVVTSVSGIALSGEPILTLLEPDSDPSTPGLSSALGWYELNSGILNTSFDDINGNILSTGDMISPCSTSTDHTLSLFFNYTNLTNENHRLIMYKDGDCSKTDAASGCSEIVSEMVSLPSSLNLLDPATSSINLSASLSNIQLNFNNSVTNFDDSKLNSLFVSGNFTEINNESYRNLAQIIIDPEDIAISETIGVGEILPPNILTDGSIDTIAVDPNTDAVYIGGTFTKFFKDGNKLFSVNSLGEITPLITSFAGSSIRAVKFDEINSLLFIGGNFWEINGISRRNFAIMDTSNGSIISQGGLEFGTGGEIYCIDFDTDYIYLGGNFSDFNSDAYRFAVIQRSNYTLVQPISQINNPGFATIFDVKVDQISGYVHVVGSFSSFTDNTNVSQTRTRYAILDKNNNFEFIPTMHPGFSSTVNSIDIDYVNNRIYIGGDFISMTLSSNSSFPTQTRRAFVAFDRNTLQHIPDNIYGFSSSVERISYDPVNNNIFVGGNFTSYYPSNTSTAGATSRARLLGFSGNSPFTVNTNLPTFSSSVIGLDVDPINNNISVATSTSINSYDVTTGNNLTSNTTNSSIFNLSSTGGFTFICGSFSEVDTVNRSRFAEIINGEVTSLNVSFNNTVDNIRVDSDSNKFIVGNFTSPNSYFTVLNSSNSNITNTSDFSPLNRIREIEVSDDNVYVSGDNAPNPKTISNSRLVNLESPRYRNNLFSNLVVNNGRIHTIEYNPDQNYYYIGGDFTQINSVTRNRFAIIDQNGNLIDNSPGTNPSFTNFRVYKIKYYPTIQRVIVSGDFSTSGYSETIRSLAILDSTNYELVNYVGGHPLTTGSNQTIWDFDVNLNENILYVGGNFTEINTQPRLNFAAINLITGELIDIFNDYQNENLDFNSEINALEIDITNENVYIGGNFTNIGADIGKVASYDTSGNRLSFPVEITSTTSTHSLNQFAENTNYMFFGGYFTEVNGQPRNNLAVYNKNTQQLENFSTNPDFGSGYRIFAIEIDPDNENIVYFGGDFIQPRNRFTAIDFSTNPPTILDSFEPSDIVRTIKCYNDSIFLGGDFDGRFTTLDKNTLNVKSFAPSGGEDLNFNNDVYDIEINENINSMYIGGLFTNETKPVNRYAKLDSNGDNIPDTIKFNSTVTDAIEVSGNYYVVGSFTEINGKVRHRFAAFNRNSEEILKSDIGFNTTIECIEYDEIENLLYVGGNFTSTYQTIQRFGSFDKNTKNFNIFDINVNNQINTIAYENGKYYIGGSFTIVNGETRNRFAVFDSSGNLLPEKINFDNTVFSIKTDSQNLYIGGSFDSINNINTYYFAIFDIVTLENKEFIDALETQTVPGVNSTVYDVEIDEVNDRIYLGGIFTLYTASNRNFDSTISNINKFCVIDKNDGSRVTTNFPSLGSWGSTVWDIELDQNNNRVYVGGDFSATGISNFMVLDNSIYSEILSISGNQIPQFNSDVKCIEYDSISDEVYIGGRFTSITNLSVTRDRFTSFNGSDFSLINYAQNPSFTGTSSFSTEVLSIHRDGSKIYVGGDFTTLNGSPAQKFAILNSDGSVDDTQTVNVDNDVIDIISVGDDISFVGNFTQNSVTSSQRFEAIDLSTLTLVELSGNPEFNSTVYDIKVDTINNDKILVGGSFTTANTISRNRFSVLNKNGTLSTENLDFNNNVRCIEIDNDNDRIYIGGRFSQVDSLSRFKFAVLDSNLNLFDLSTIPGGSNPSIQSLNNFRDVLTIEYKNNRIFLGGTFDDVNAESRIRFAEIQTDGNIVTHSTNPSFNSDVTDIVYDDINNKVYVGGSFTNVNSDSNIHRISRFNSFDLSQDNFSTQFFLDSNVNKIFLNGNDIELFGSFSNYTRGIERFAVYDLNNYKLVLEPSRPRLTSFGVIYTLNINDNRNELYIGGQFSSVNNESRTNFAAFTTDLTGGFSLIDYVANPSISNVVNSIESSGNQIFVVGDSGEFNFIEASDGSLTKNSDDFYINSDIKLVSILNNGLLIGGEFTQVNQKSANRFVALSKFLEYQPFSINDYPSFNNSVTDIKIDYSSDRVYTVGDFSSPSSKISYIDKNTGEFGPSGPFINSTVQSLDLTPSKVIIGGDFSLPRERFAILDKDTLQIEDIDIRFTSTVQDVFYDSINSNILVGGFFPSYEYLENNITQINRNTLQVSNNFEIINGTVNTIKYDSINDILFSGGNFESIEFISSQNLAAISGSTTVLSSNYQIDSTVTALDLDEINQVIYIGGNSSFSLAPSGGNLISLDYDGNLLSEANVNGSINFLSTSEGNKMLFVGGNFNEVNSEFRNNFAMFGDYEVNPETYNLFGRNENGSLNFIILSETNYQAFVTNNCIACSATVDTSASTSATSAISGSEMDIDLEDALIEIGEEGIITFINENNDKIGNLYLDIDDINFPSASDTSGSSGGGGGKGGPGDDPEDNNNCCGQVACFVPGPVVYCPKPSITVGFNVDNFDFNKVSFDAPGGGVQQTTNGGQTATFTWVNSPQDGTSLPITITYTGGCIDGVTDIVYETEIESVKETTISESSVSKKSEVDGVGCTFQLKITVAYDPKLEDEIPESLIHVGDTFWRRCDKETNVCVPSGLLGNFEKNGNIQVDEDGLFLVDYIFAHTTSCDSSKYIKYDELNIFLYCGQETPVSFPNTSCECCKEPNP